ncbi:PASTA domain-containing protein [Kitasatospora herbaricolor]|uniref:PASTA domain-containing protein n=1 Tax=Kitasatospora herbaricolor TaxID=68217 RepID=A0ABZ1WKS7_9ACTN|nr:PASTA domain-containing protein [Kitasatospora herbaricolor]
MTSTLRAAGQSAPGPGDGDAVRAVYFPLSPPASRSDRDRQALRGWIEAVAADPGADGQSADPGHRAGAEEAAADRRIRRLTAAAASVITAATTRQWAADQLGDSGASAQLLATARSEVSGFVDGLLASPPACEPVVAPPVGHWLVVGGVLVWVPRVGAPPPAPLQDLGAELSARELAAVGVQFRVVAETLAAGPLREHLAAAADRLAGADVSRADEDQPGFDVPDVTGFTEEEAVTALSNQGYVPYVIQDYDRNVTFGHVIFQRPRGGPQADLVTVVRVHVSLGSPPPVTPYHPDPDVILKG